MLFIKNANITNVDFYVMNTFLLRYLLLLVGFLQDCVQ